MNTLFIIGNGLDLAHGLETRYEDFLFWLLKKELIEALENHSCEQNYTTKTNQVFHSFTISSQFDTNNKDVFKTTVTSQLNTCTKLNDIKKNFIDETHTFEKLNFKNRIIKSSIDNYNSANWSDIEWQYFKLLSEILSSEKGIPLIDHTANNISKLIQLNKDLDYLAKELNTYLGDKYATFNPNIELVNNYNQILLRHEGSNNLILNFNYTSTISHCPIANDYDLIQIHGTLGQINPLVFGYGDETTLLYKEMEDQNDFEFLRHTKSSRYAENDNYHKVHSFIHSFTTPHMKSKKDDLYSQMEFQHIDQSIMDGDFFEVVILGHSCGLSDRVLLKEILERENCTNIHVYYYDNKKGDSDFLRTVSNISRHFDKNVNMRSKLKPLDVENRMPQWND